MKDTKGTKKVTKSQVIKALKTEPLGAEYVYVAYRYNPNLPLGPDEKIVKKDCYLCAVGAVVRNTTGIRNAGKLNVVSQASVKRAVFEKPLSEEKSLKKAIRQILVDPLGALSAYYETLLYDVTFGDDRQYIIDTEIRPKLISFVKEHFPASVTLRGL